MTAETGHEDATSCDVLVVGGGPAGCSAGVFTARAGLETHIVEHRRSLLRKSAHLENYLGFPDGVRPQTFLEIARDHARTAGCTYETATVESVERTDGDAGRFRAATTDGVIDAAFVLVASWSDCSFLEAVGVETGIEEGGHVPIVEIDDDGRTSVEGIYAAGRLTDQHHQAIVNAGHGAHVALALVRDVRPSYYNDWVVPEGYYEAYDRAVPDGVEAIDHEERERRLERSRRTMRTYFAERPEE
ncbi:NAD(P)/FAD-dependent oxidoreductase [Natronobiforma cellulositropha]|uniref:NAD(P)/FAD-dependent oxidoreductase n=1 Tax=Natronobiforma cellulositropha TaxID=1679076 RepID=UPI0021D5C52D|nr:FAD-dependent oxidoreductase [Natronobiforma cellulositropha]